MVVKLKERREGVRLLGEYRPERSAFPGVEELVERLASAQRSEIHQALLNQIEAAPRESFLLPEVVDFIARIVDRVDSGYTLLGFERWLDSEGQMAIRAKIAGRYLPREEYQTYFPIGLGRTYPGIHIVTAHSPPDLDTAVASFWGWVDAFAARVSSGGHQWNLPGGAATPQIGRLFDEIIGPDLIRVVPRQSSRLTATALDIATMQGVELHTGEALTSSLDHRGLERCILLVDDEGSLLGSWLSSDVERFRTLALLLTDCWRWFASTFYDRIIALFALPKAARKEVVALFSLLFEAPLREAEPLHHLSERQIADLDGALKEIFQLESGLAATFDQFAKVLQSDLRQSMEQLLDPALYSASGDLSADRPSLFAKVQLVVREVVAAIEAFRLYIDQLGVAIEIKRRVFRQQVHYVSISADLDEVRAAIGPHHFLPVVEERDGKRLPVGVISAPILQKGSVGTVSLRDFCNREEVKIAPHLETISVVDHHRSSLETSSFLTAILGDVQSSNTLLAELSMAINDRYSVGGPLSERHPTTNRRIQLRELQREIAAETRGDWFVHPKREMVEYLSYLYAILDDTDLLSRVTRRDVVAVAGLLNRMVSILSEREVEVVDFDDLPRDQRFAKAAAERLLQNEQMYSLYSRIYAVREEEVASELVACVEGSPSSLFADTKEQKRCARVGQMKLFPNNFPLYAHHREALRRYWVESAQEAHAQRPELQLHIQMVSTIAGAEEVYSGAAPSYTHEDELWIWLPHVSNESCQRLESFLTAFKGGAASQSPVEVELFGECEGEIGKLFTCHFERRASGEESALSMAVLKCAPGVFTSRKSHITPYLPSN